ncbi:MAG: cupin domain-containing protein [Chloroflexota bacterium]
MSIVPDGPFEPMVGDPDDHRPESRWRLVVDPGDERGRVDSLALIIEEIAVGDRIPLHTHDVDEAITILQGDAETRLGDERRRVGSGAIIFIPAGTPHGTANAGAQPLHIHAVFPTLEIEIDTLERNPAPGTEGDPPRRTRYDLRTGDFEMLE